MRRGNKREKKELYKENEIVLEWTTQNSDGQNPETRIRGFARRSFNPRIRVSGFCPSGFWSWPVLEGLLYIYLKFHIHIWNFIFITGGLKPPLRGAEPPFGVIPTVIQIIFIFARLLRVTNANVRYVNPPVNKS